MKWEVIRSFTDITNGDKYAVGDRYPHRGFPSKVRVEQLSTENNKRGIPLIKSVETVKEEKPAEEATPEVKFYTKSDINGMKVAELKKLAKENEIEGADDMTGTELKNVLIDKMGL